MLRNVTPGNRIAAGRHAAGGLMVLAMLVLIGCAANRAAIRERHDPQGRPYTFKRIERFPQRDFVHHWTRTAYRAPKMNFTARGNPAGQALLEEWDAPTWIRKPFVSLLGERVEEWLYLDKNALFQFIGGELVYDGAVTDYERTLLGRGYPDRVESARKEDDTRVHIFIYHSIFNPALETYQFSNDGTIIQSEEGK